MLHVYTVYSTTIQATNLTVCFLIAYKAEIVL